MHDIDTICKLNSKHVGGKLAKASAEGKYAVVTYTGLNAIDVDVVDDADAAQARAEKIKGQGIVFRTEICPPAAQRELPLTA